MSKNNSTKDLILTHALKLFNERGVEYVGVREIAKDLNLRVGNITYYFPIKDDIVVAIANQLAELNNRSINPVEGLTMQGFLKMYKQIFENHYLFSCLFISFVQQMERNTKLEKSYMSTQQKRYQTLKINLTELMENKFLKNTVTEEQLEYLVAALSLTARFWLSESRIRFKGVAKNKIFKHYLTLISYHLAPYTTQKGQKEIKAFILSL